MWLIKRLEISLSFKNAINDPTRDYFDKYYMQFLQVEYLNSLIDNKPFFDQPVKINKKLMKNLLMTSIQQGIYQTFHIIKIIIHSLVQICDLSRQANMNISQ